MISCVYEFKENHDRETSARTVGVGIQTELFGPTLT
jgi:hypothetical protein